MDEDEPIRALDAEVFRAIDDFPGLPLLKDLKAVFDGNRVGFAPRLVHAVRDSAELGRRAAFEQGNTNKRHLLPPKLRTQSASETSSEVRLELARKISPSDPAKTL